MKTHAELKSEWDYNLGRMKTIHAKSVAENRDLTKAEADEFDRFKARADEMHDAIKRGDSIEAGALVSGALSYSAPVAGSNRVGVGCEVPLGAGERGDVERWKTSDGRTIRAFGPTESMTESKRAAMAERGVDLSEVSLGRILKAKLLDDTRHLTDSEQKLVRADPLAENVNSAGGWTVPEILSSMWFDLARAKSVLIQAGARRVEMSSDALLIAKLNTDPTHQVKGENDLFSGSGPTFGRVGLFASTFGQVVTASEELLQDSPNISDMIEQSLSASLAAKIDYWFLRGSGGTEPAGILLNTSINTASAVSGWDTLMLGMLECEQDNFKPTAWIASPTTANTLRSLRIDSGDGAYLQPPADIVAMKRLVTTQIEDTDVLVGDFSGCVLGIRQQARLDVSAEAGESFERFQRKVRITARMAMGVAQPDALCLCS